MATWRVNTPGPSFTVEADTLDQATSKAVGRGLPYSHERGDVVVQFTAEQGRGAELRYVHLYTRAHGMADPYTGFVLYKEVCSGCGAEDDLARVPGAPGGTLWCSGCRAFDQEWD